MKKFIFAIAAMALLIGCEKNEPQNPNDNPADDGSVSTKPEYRKVVIEEYTGIGCQYCPDGHRIVNELMKAYKNRLFAVNIHAGGYASRYYTEDGDAYLTEAEVSGFPAGVVNRHFFDEYSSGGLAINRGYFSSASRKLLTMMSPVNIAATAVINKKTRELTVEVNGYYTSDPVDEDSQTLTSNYLYVMLLQDSVMGPQSSGAKGNPDQYDEETGLYCHMHMFRKTINGRWGDEINPVSAGSWFNKKYTYTIPETMGGDNLPTVLEHMRVLVFVAADHNEIYTAAAPNISYK